MSQKILITIDDDLAEWLNGQSNKSEITRQALIAYKTESPVLGKLNDLKRCMERRFNMLESALPTNNNEADTPPLLNLGMACCAMKRPCKHWHFDDIEAVWVNELTKETRGA